MFFPFMTLCSQFEIVEIAGETVAVAVGDSADKFHGVVTLQNDSARFLFEKLQEGITLPELIKTCMDRYEDSTVEEVGPKVLEFLDQLKAQNLIRSDPERGIRVEAKPRQSDDNGENP